MNEQMLEVVNRLGHFGYIPPRDRTDEQTAAHNAALLHRQAFNLTAPVVPKGTKVMLTDSWKDPTVVADIGQPFTGFYQFTGSCVGVSTGNAIMTLSAIQRLLATNPTKAIIPFWGYDYGTCRGNEGDRGQGEGAVDSVMFQTLIKNGCLDSSVSGLPKFNVTGDGYQLTQSLEMQWSNPSGPCQNYTQQAKSFPLGSAATLNSVADIKAAILNGYPVLDGCDNYIGTGSLSSGVALGTYDGAGGHSTCYLGYWEHDTLGPLYLYSNQWATSTYPDDGSGKGRCTVWVLESNVAKLFSTGGQGGETAALSHLTSLPAQPAILDWFA